MSNVFLRILQSNLNRQGLISTYPLNEASQDPTGLKNNGSKTRELLIVGLLLSILCDEEGPSFLRITYHVPYIFIQFLLPHPGPSSANHLLSLRSSILL